jgi:ADP-ribose pyrophosphatase YjhB (NUDIX family)
MVWKPNVTVAAIVEQDGKFLLVEEEAGGEIVLNQPAGHWERNESLQQGASREALEETGYHFAPTALVGIYRWPHPKKEITYLRFAFAGHITGHDAERKLDEGIIRAVWLTPAEIQRDLARHRSPLVLRCIEDYLAGRRYPLELLTHFD